MNDHYAFTLRRQDERRLAADAEVRRTTIDAVVRLRDVNRVNKSSQSGVAQQTLPLTSHLVI